jgi:hypothetical protein
LKQAAKNEICPLIKALTQIPQADSIRLFLCGDVMTGRGIDQVLPHPNDARLREPYIVEVRSYVELAERVNGAIPRPVSTRSQSGTAEKGCLQSRVGEILGLEGSSYLDELLSEGLIYCGPSIKLNLWRPTHVGGGLEYRFNSPYRNFRRNCLCLPESVKQQLYTD